MDFGQAFTFPFQDQEWPRKILIPALISLIPIVGQLFLLGWALDVTRRVIRHDPTPLPELEFGKQIVDGLKAFVVGFIYALPIIVLEVPITIASSLAGSNSDQSSTMVTLVTIVSLCCGGLIFLYGLALAMLLPAAMGNMVANESLGAGLRFGEVFGLVRSAPGAYLIVLLGVIVSGFVGGLGAIACVIGVFVTYAYAMAINGHLYGQAYNEATKNKGFARVY